MQVIANHLSSMMLAIIFLITWVTLLNLDHQPKILRISQTVANPLSNLQMMLLSNPLQILCIKMSFWTLSGTMMPTHRSTLTTPWMKLWSWAKPPLCLSMINYNPPLHLWMRMRIWIPWTLPFAKLTLKLVTCGQRLSIISNLESKSSPTSINRDLDPLVISIMTTD